MMTTKKKKELYLTEYKKFSIFAKELSENIKYLEDVVKNESSVFRNVRKTSILSIRTKEYSSILKELKRKLKDMNKDLSEQKVEDFMRKGILIYLGVEDLRNDIIFSLQYFDEKKNKIDYSVLYEMEQFH